MFGLTYYHHISGKMWHQEVVSRGGGGHISVNKSLCRIFSKGVSWRIVMRTLAFISFEIPRGRGQAKLYQQ